MRRMPLARLRLEKSASRSCSANLTPWFSLLHFADSGFMMCCRSVMNKSVLDGSPCLVSPLEVELFAFDDGVY